MKILLRHAPLKLFQQGIIQTARLLQAGRLFPNQSDNVLQHRCKQAVILFPAGFFPGMLPFHRCPGQLLHQLRGKALLTFHHKPGLAQIGCHEGIIAITGLFPGPVEEIGKRRIGAHGMESGRKPLHLRSPVGGTTARHHTLLVPAQNRSDGLDQRLLPLHLQ